MKRNLKIIVVLLLLNRLKAQTTSDGCLLLQGSTSCPAYASFYIGLTGNQQTYSFLSNVTDVNSFDTALSNYVSSSDFYATFLGCSSDSNHIPYTRYAKTFMCATLIQDSQYSLPCNYENNVSPPPLCQGTCFDFTANLNDTLSSTCPVTNLNTTCQSWSGLNGTINCILGLANEPANCGFGSISSACAYCASSTDNCCQSVSCHTLSTGVMIGIIIASLVFAGGVGAFFWFWYKRNNKNGHRPLKHESILRNAHFAQDDSASVLGYESLTSKNALLSHPPEEPVQPPDTALEEFYEVKHPYPPQMGDELGLHVGDIVCVAMNFDDGWALGFNVTTGLKGVFPVVCVAPAPEELLEQLLQAEQPSTKTLVDDNHQLQQICENIRRSISINSKHTLPVSELTNHNSIPRRTASIMRNYHDSPGSQTSTPHTHHTTHSEIIEMHPKYYNRVSKLQEQ